MIAVVKLYIEGTKEPFCEINMNHITRRQLDTVINNAHEWLEIVTEQIGSPHKDLACSRCADLISVLKYVLKAKNINEFQSEKETIIKMIDTFFELKK